MKCKGSGPAHSSARGGSRRPKWHCIGVRQPVLLFCCIRNSKHLTLFPTSLLAFLIHEFSQARSFQVLASLCLSLNASDASDLLLSRHSRLCQHMSWLEHCCLCHQQSSSLRLHKLIIVCRWQHKHLLLNTSAHINIKQNY